MAAVQGVRASMPLDLSVLEGKDPAGYEAEHLIKQRIAKELRPDDSEAEASSAFHSKASSGSVAAADSSQFHAYRKNRRHELERLEAFDKARKLQEEEAVFLSERAQKISAVQAKTAKNRAKRLRKKAQKD